MLSSVRYLKSRLWRCLSNRITETRSGPLVVAIAGPTAVGKSSVAAILCSRLNGDIISVDSVQVYKELSIGSAKPTPQEQAATRYHMINTNFCNENMSAGEFARQAKNCVDTILDEGRLPVLVGGSTLWMDFITQGMPNAPKSDPRINSAVEKLVRPYEEHGLWDELVLDITEHLPDDKTYIYKELSRNNWIRLKRYLVIDFTISMLTVGSNPEDIDFTFENLSGAFFTGVKKKLLPALGTSPAQSNDEHSYDMRQFYMHYERELLYRIIEMRCEEMIRHGLLEEVGKLLLDGILTPDTAVWKAIGYRQATQYLCRDEFKCNDYPAFLKFVRSEHSESNQDFATATRNYANKQSKWYLKKNDFLWINGNQSKEDVASEIEQWCNIPRQQYQKAIDMQVSFSELNQPKSKHSPGDFSLKQSALISADLLQFKTDNPEVGSSFDISARLRTSEERENLRRYVQIIGFIPVPNSVKKSINGELPQYTQAEEEIWCKESTIVKDIVSCADNISLKVRDLYSSRQLHEIFITKSGRT